MVYLKSILSLPGVVPSVVPPALDGSVIVRKSGLLPLGRSLPQMGDDRAAAARRWPTPRPGGSRTGWPTASRRTRSGTREAVEKTSLKYQTLRNYAWVARRFRTVTAARQPQLRAPRGGLRARPAGAGLLAAQGGRTGLVRGETRYGSKYGTACGSAGLRKRRPWAEPGSKRTTQRSPYG